MINQVRIRTVFLTLLILIIAACDKEDANQIATGNIKEGGHKLHNLILTGVDNGITNYQSKQIDVDDDGVQDFEFRSYEDSVFYPERTAKHWINIKVINASFTVAHIPGSGMRRMGDIRTLYDYDDGYPRKMVYYPVECGSAINGEYSIPDHTKNYNKGELIYSDEVWTTQDELTVAFYGGSDGTTTLNETNDTIISKILNLPGGCGNPLFINNFYVAFRKDNGGEISIGWIELNVHYSGKLAVLRSVIKVL